jgi:DNA polymerase-3 subunit beta
MFKLNNTTLISRLIEGDFPNYEQVIPAPAKEKILVQRDQFLSGARRAALLTTQDSQSIKIDILKDKMIISKSNPSVGEAKEEVDIVYKGPEMSVGFNPNYLMDVLKVLPKDEVEIELLGPDKPAVIRIEERCLYLVLPMQLT